MRWLLLNHNLRHRGTWHRAWGIARELARRGEQVELWDRCAAALLPLRTRIA